MIFQTQNQLNCLLIFIYFGIICGLVSIFYNLLFLQKYQKKLIKTTINTIFHSFFSIFFAILIFFYNLGNFSFVLFCSFVLGFILIQTLSQKSVVILEKKWYTIINNLITNLKNKKNKGKVNEQSKKS